MKNLTFGIEIELTGLTRKAAAEATKEVLGEGATITSLGFRDFKVIGPDGRHWSLVYDGSLRAEKKDRGRKVTAGDEYKVELVSPICKYEDIELVQEITRSLRKAGSFVNPSCGIHIHIGKEKFTPQSLRNLVNIISSKEDLIYKALDVQAGRAASYCKKVDENLVKRLNEAKPKSLSQFENIWYRNYSSNRIQRYHPSRYFGLNLHPTFQGDTVEFRFFNSTTHAGKVKGYIQLALAISNQALTQKSASAKKTTTTNAKYTFRTWLLRLGMIGEEFKTARLHLLKELEGDTAFKNGRPERMAAGE